MNKKGYLSMCTLYSHFSLCFMTIFHYIMSHTIYYKVFFLLILFYTFFSSSLLSQTFFLCVSFIEKVSLESKKGYIPLERSLNVSCTKRKNVSLLYFLSPFNCLCCSRGRGKKFFFASAAVIWWG